MLNEKPSWKKWQLLTEMGRQIWAFKPDSPHINEHLQNVGSLSNEDIAQFTEDFRFDSSINPNSGDAVYRRAAYQANFQTFSGILHPTNHPGQQEIAEAIVKAIQYFSCLQSTEGHWPGDYGGPLFLLPGILIAAYITESPFPAAHQALMKQYMFNHQNNDAGWGLHIEGESTMFGTVMHYVALRILGVDQQHPNLITARSWIKAHGGAKGIPSWGKFYLALLNLYAWEGFNSLFPEMWLFPKWLPFHPSRYWCHSRMVYLPMAYCYAERIQAPKTELIQSLREELYCENFEDIDWPKQRNTVCETDHYTSPSQLLKWMNGFTNGYEKIHCSWLRNKALAYIVTYLDAEDQQTQYINIGPVSKAINSICAWHYHGKDSTQFKQHTARWYDYLWLAEDGMKMNGYNGSQLWDTAFATRAILESDLGRLFHETLAKSFSFIEQMQIKTEQASHAEFFRHPMVGSWPFSTTENGWPVADCTAEGLSAILAVQRAGLVKPDIISERMQQAIDSILSYQNTDGGWATYELTRAPKWLEKLNPSEIFADIMLDHSWTECTAACVLALLEFQETDSCYKHDAINKAIRNGIQFILKQQKPDGSWYGGWAICFTYATWFGVEALSKAIGKGHANDAQLKENIAKACTFLIGKQSSDGGWGETFESCSKLVYTQTPTAQVVNTAWALMALMAAQFDDRHVIEKAIRLLLDKQQDNGDWLQERISGVFNYNCMITYANYRNIFPIWALSRYWNYLHEK